MNYALTILPRIIIRSAALLLLLLGVVLGALLSAFPLYLGHLLCCLDEWVGGGKFENRFYKKATTPLPMPKEKGT